MDDGPTGDADASTSLLCSRVGLHRSERRRSQSMSDLMSDAGRQEAFVTDLASALDRLRNVLEGEHDVVWGMPGWVLEDIGATLEPFGYVVTLKGGNEP